MSLNGLEIIDCWMNVPGCAPDPSASYLFPGMAERWAKQMTPTELVEEMAAGGVARAVLVSGWGEYDSVSWVRQALKEYPDIFTASHIVDPRGGLKTLQLIDHLVRDEGYKSIRMLAFDTQVGYDDARCYPIYGKCAELAAVLCLNVGMAGPRVPSRCQHPLALDEICHHFPELKLVMAHGGEPWEALCVKLMLKWPNLYYMTSAFAPRYIPEAIVKFLNTRGKDRILWASDHPIITFQRCLEDIPAMTFRDDETKACFLGGNAKRLFFPDK